MTDRARPRGSGLIVASWVGTMAFAATALPAAGGLEAVEPTSLVVELVLFVASLPVAFMALATAAVRVARRGERITVTGLFFLSGSAPRGEKLRLLGSLGVTVATSVAALALSSANGAPQAFAALVPVYPLAVTGLWAARHGTFPALPDPTPRQEKPRSRAND